MRFEILDLLCEIPRARCAGFAVPRQRLWHRFDVVK